MLPLKEGVALSEVVEKGAQNIIMSAEYKAMFEEWKNHTDDFQNLLLDYENVDDNMKPWSEIYQRANVLFKEKVWYQRPRANPLDKPIVEEENYKNTIYALRDDYNCDLEPHDDYAKKFKTWLKAYPSAKKKSIIDEHDKNWSAIYKNFHEIFKGDVWNEYRHKMSTMRKKELNTYKRNAFER